MSLDHGSIEALLLWLIPAALVVFVFIRVRGTAKLEILLRFLTLSLLFVAMLGPFVEKRIEFSRAAVLLDISDSMDEGAVQLLLRRIEQFQRQGLELDIFPFSYETRSQALPASGLGSYKSIRESGFDLNIGQTNLEKALLSPRLTPGMNVLLISDGNETKGNIRREVEKLRSTGIHIFPLAPEEERQSERHTNIAQIAAPLVAPVSRSAEIRVTLANPSASREIGSLVIEHDAQTIFDSRVEVDPGSENVYTALSDPSKEGIKEVTATFRPLDPSLSPSIRTIFLSGERREKVLLVNGSREDARFLPLVLNDQAYQLKTLTESEAEKLPELSDFSAIIFNNVARSQLPSSAPEKVQRYIAQGGGFIMIGGERSFGLGDYRQTPIESVLPVSLLPPQSKQKRLNIAVELVVDKSKSMADERKIEFVKDAAREVVRNLKDDDLLGVVGFDTNPFVAVPLGPVSEIRSLAQDRLAILFAHGKTNLFPAMDEAKRSLERARAGRKHMIILTDGELPDAGPHYVEFVRQMRFSGITVSTVLIGPEFDRLLRQMGEVGGGAFYNTNDPQALPRIFLKDVKVRAGEETMKEQQEFEVRKGTGTISSTTARSFPLLYGFVQTQPKENANLELVLMNLNPPQAFPLLASWNYQKGKSVAFTSDANGRWSRNWVEWGKFRQFWDEIVASVRATRNTPDNIKFDLRYYLQGASLVLDLTLITPVPGARVRADIVFPDGSKRTAEFDSSVKGRYKTEIKDPLPGKYELQGLVDESKLTPVAFELSGELFGEKKGRGFNLPLLEEIASATGGKVNPSLEDVRASKGEKIERTDLSSLFVLMAILCLAAEIFVRELLPKLLQGAKARK